MIPKPIPLLGTFNLTYTISGMFFTDLYYGTEPELIIYSSLSGASSTFSSLEFQSGASYSGGSFILGSFGTSGVLQTFDLQSRTVISSYAYPLDLSSDNVEDFT